VEDNDVVVVVVIVARPVTFLGLLEEVFQPSASSSAIISPVVEDLSLRLRFFPDDEEEGSALRYLEAR